jgi:hypothetical protein
MMKIDVYTRDHDVYSALEHVLGRGYTAEPGVFAFLGIRASDIPSSIPSGKIEIRESATGNLLSPLIGGIE